MDINSANCVVEEIIFLGSGTSEGVPRVSCLSLENPACEVCIDALDNPNSHNLRKNTCMMIRVTNKSDSRVRNIVIDCGKFFWHQALKWFTKYKLRYIDAILITHAHNDALFGIDDLRDWTRNIPDNGAISMFIRPKDLEIAAKAFDYLVDMDHNAKSTGGGVSDLKWNTIHEDKTFTVHGLDFYPFAVNHGSVDCLGFKFKNIVYISDCKYLTEDHRKLAIGCDILILDMLRLSEAHSSHFILEESIKEVLIIRPKRAIFIGMNHEVEHNSVNKKLEEIGKKEGIQIELAYDGMRVPVNY